MIVNIPVDKLLKEYKVNKARISFLESQISRYHTGVLPDYIQLVVHTAEATEEGTSKISQGEGCPEKLGWVMEAGSTYSISGNSCCNDFCTAARKEITTLKYFTGIIEDALITLDGIDSRYKMIIERFYIDGDRMEEIAASLHMSRSRCYELCKASVACITRIICGTGQHMPDHRQGQQLLCV